MDLNVKLREVLSHYNVCSKESVIRQYDHEVQGTSVIKPLVGARCDGPSDASVLAPRDWVPSRHCHLQWHQRPLWDDRPPGWPRPASMKRSARSSPSAEISGRSRSSIIFAGAIPTSRTVWVVWCARRKAVAKAAVGLQGPFYFGQGQFVQRIHAEREILAIPGTLLISAIGIIAT